MPPFSTSFLQKLSVFRSAENPCFVKEVRTCSSHQEENQPREQVTLAKLSATVDWFSLPSAAVMNIETRESRELHSLPPPFSEGGCHAKTGVLPLVCFVSFHRLVGGSEIWSICKGIQHICWKWCVRYFSLSPHFQWSRSLVFGTNFINDSRVFTRRSPVHFQTAFSHSGNHPFGHLPQDGGWYSPLY